MPSYSAVASDTVRQRPAVAGVVVVAAAVVCRIDSALPVRASCRSPAASQLECVACQLAVPLVRVRCPQENRQPSHRPLHFRYP